jgi:hypothetical protein
MDEGMAMTAVAMRVPPEDQALIETKDAMLRLLRSIQPLRIIGLQQPEKRSVILFLLVTQMELPNEIREFNRARS